jgi:hypothetical protein
LTGPGVIEGENDQAFYLDGGLVARTGDPAPGAPAGVLLDDFGFQLSYNNAGQAVFIAELTGAGVTEQSDKALYAVDPLGGMLLIAREGASFDIGGGDLRTVADDGIGVRLGSDGSDSDDMLTSLGNDGTLAFSLRFTDMSGVFTVSIPEPGLLSASIIGCLALPLRRRWR